MSDLTDQVGELVEQTRRHLLSNNFLAAVEIFTCENYRACLEKKSWDLIPVLCENLNISTKQNNEPLVSCCEQLLEALSRVAKPEDAVVELLQQLDEADDIKFQVLLKSLSIVVQRDSLNRVNSLEWCLDAIKLHLENLSIQENDYVGCSNQTLCFSEDRKKVIQLFEASVEFYSTFVLQALSDQTANNNDTVKDLLSSRIIQTFEITLAYAQYVSSHAIKIIQHKLTTLVLRLIANPYTLLEYIFCRSVSIMRPKCQKNPLLTSRIDDLRYICDVPYRDLDPVSTSYRMSLFEDDSLISDLSYGIFFCTLLTEDVQKVHLCRIYNPKYVFLSLSYVTIPLFSKSQNSAVQKGLILLESILNQLIFPLNQTDLYFSTHKILLRRLNETMVYSEVAANRRLALKCFQKYIESFDLEARYWLLFNLRTDVDHSGTLGVIINFLKDAILQHLNYTSNLGAHKNEMKYYRGKLLFDLIKKYCFLVHGPSTDLVESADHIISSLNLLRFLVLRDKENITDVKNFIKKIQADFLKPLKQSVALSKAHYQVKLNDLVANAGSYFPTIEVSVHGQTIPKLTCEEQKSLCHNSLNAISLIESLLVRLSECIHLAFSYSL